MAWKEMLHPQLNKIEEKVRADDIKEQIERLIFTHMIDQNSMAIIEGQKSTDYDLFMRHLDIFKRDAKDSEKEQIFDYLIGYFLTHDFSTIISSYTGKKSEEMDLKSHRNDTQTLLFNKEVSLDSFSGMTTSTPQSINHMELSFVEQLLSRIFFKLNFFHPHYIPKFITTCEHILRTEKHKQETITSFMDKNVPRILQDPVTSRMAEFINRTGDRFLDAVAHIDKGDKRDNGDKGDKGDKGKKGSRRDKFYEKAPIFTNLLHEYLSSSSGDKIFPKWFKNINQNIRKQVVDDLLEYHP